MTDNTKALETAAELTELLRERGSPDDAMKALIFCMVDLFLHQIRPEAHEAAIGTLVKDIRNILAMSPLLVPFDEIPRDVSEESKH